MNLFILILVCLSLAACKPTEEYCHWTGCEGQLRSGVDICAEYGYKFYTGDTDGSECNFDASKVHCCNDPHKPKIYPFDWKFRNSLEPRNGVEIKT